MSFQFPGTYAELREHHFLEMYKVTNKNQVPHMDERLIHLKMNQLSFGFDALETIIEDSQYFDFFYYLVDHLDHHPNQRIQLQLIEILTYQISKMNQENTQAFKMTLFLLLNLLKQKGIQGQIIKKTLKVLISLFEQPIIQKIGREGSRYFFDVVKMAQEIKDNSIRETWIQFLIMCHIQWSQFDVPLKDKIIHLMHEQENVVSSISKLIIACFRNDKTKTYAIDQLVLIVNYISQNSTNQTESLAVKNLRELLCQTSKEVPKLFQSQLSGLIQLYENENYHIRNGLTEVISSVIESLIKEDNKDENIQSNIDNLIKQLIDRHTDKTALCRSCVLQCFGSLVVRNSIPKHLLSSIFILASQRLRDISGYVRKAALQLVKSIIKYYTMIFVKSQGRTTFWSEQDTEQISENNILDLEQVHKELEEIDKLYQAGNQIDESEIEVLRRKAAETIKSQSYLDEYIKLVNNMKTVINQVLQLCQSKNQADVIHSIKLFAYLKKYEFQNCQIGINKMLLLVWSQDKAVQTEVLKKFFKLYFKRLKTNEIIIQMIILIKGANLKELVSIEKILECYELETSQYKLPQKLFKTSWANLPTTNDLKSNLIFIRIQLSQRNKLLSQDRVIQLMQIIQKSQQQEPDWTVIKEISTILFQNSNNQIDKPLDMLIALLVQFQGTKCMHYFAACESIIQLASISAKPEEIYECLLQQMAYNKERIEEEDQELQQLYLAHSIYAAGTVSLQMLIFIDDVNNEIKKLRNEKEKKIGKEQEIDKIAGGTEAEFEKLHETLFRIQDQHIVLVEDNILSVYAPIVKDIIQQVLNSTSEPTHSPLVQVSLITMCKFMCLSQTFCKENLKFLFQIMKSPYIDQVMKNNVIISIGDLLHRWPNTVQQFHKQIYSNLTDQSATVRRVTLLVLTHLILNDMIKSKTSLAHIPLLLSDPHPQIPPMARYFLNELSKKEQRAISNALPDIILNVQEHNESIFHQIAQYIDKHQIDSIVDRLITTMANSENDYEVKNIALVLNLIPLNQSSLQKLLDGFEEYRQKLKDDYVQTQFQHLVKKFRKALNTEAKPMIDEYESKIENHDKETFDGRRRENNKISKKKQHAAKNQNQAQQPQQGQQIGTQPATEKENKTINKPKRQVQKKRKEVNIESDDEEEMELESDEPEIIRKTSRKRQQVEEE